MLAGKGLFSVYAEKTYEIGGVIIDSSSSVNPQLKELDLALLMVPRPMAEYVPARHLGNTVYVPGQGLIKDAKPVCVGRMGEAVTTEEGYDAAQVCILNQLATVKEVRMVLCVASDLMGESNGQQQ